MKNKKRFVDVRRINWKCKTYRHKHSNKKKVLLFSLASISFVVPDGSVCLLLAIYLSNKKLFGLVVFRMKERVRTNIIKCVNMIKRRNRKVYKDYCI